MPEWLGPRDGELPGFVPIRVVLWRDGDIVIVLRDIEAYRTGVAFGLTIHGREPLMDPIGFQVMAGAGGVGELRIGVGFSDGRRTATGDRAGLAWDPTTPPDGSILIPRGGGGGGHRWDMGMWLWPLPPPGELVVAVQWDERGVPETLHTLDAGVVLEAAARAEHLWDPSPGPPGRAWERGTTMAIRTAHRMPPPPPPDPDAPPEITGDVPPDRDDAVAGVLDAYQRAFRGDSAADAVGAIDDGSDLRDAIAARAQANDRFPPTTVTTDVVAFVDHDHAVLRWSVHGATPTPFRIESRFVRTGDGWKARRASVLHVLRLAGVPTPPD
jgi:hypothetical protein